MAEIAESKLIVLIESEIRLAARLVSAAVELGTKENRTDEENDQLSQAMLDALNACAAALHGADNEDAGIVVSAVPLLKMKMKKKSKEGV